MAFNYSDVRVQGGGLDVTVAHGTSGTQPIQKLACGPFDGARPTRGIKYTITLTPDGPPPGHRFSISMYCTFEGQTSDFSINPPRSEKEK
jgi:hypothetical protein